MFRDLSNAIEEVRRWFFSRKGSLQGAVPEAGDDKESSLDTRAASLESDATSLDKPAEKFEFAGVDEEEQIQKYERAIAIWHNHAVVAFQQESLKLSNRALRRKWQYQKRLAEHEGTPVPREPEKAEEIF